MPSSYISNSDKPYQILVLTNELKVEKDLKAQLQSLGYEVSAVICSGEQPEQITNCEKYDLVLLDVKSDRTGFDINQFATENENLPIVILTTVSNQPTIVEIAESSHISFLKKPYIPNELRLTIEMNLYKTRIDQEYRHKEARLNLVIEGSGLGTWECDFKADKVTFSQHWATILGFDHSEIVHSFDDWLKRIHPEDFPQLIDIAEKHFNGLTEYYSTEHRVLTKTGQWKWIHDSGKVISRSADGKPLKMVGLSEDIDKRKQREQEIEQKESYQRTLLDNFPFLIWLKDKKGHFRTVNKAFAEASSLEKPEDYVGKTDLDIWPEDLANAYRQDDAIVLNQLLNKTTEEEISDQGKRKWFETFKAPVLTTSGELVGTVGFARDITERKEIELKLINNEQNFSNFFNLGVDFHWVLDQKGSVLAGNEAVIQRLGYKKNEIIGMSVLDFHPPHRRDEANFIIAKMLQNEKHYCPVPLLTKAGNEIPVETYVSTGKWNGEPVIFGISKDISQLKLSEEKFSSLFQNGSAIMGLSDLKSGKYLEVNQMFLDCLGFSKEEIIGQTAIEIGILSASARDNMVNKLVQHGTLNNEEVCLNTRSGRIIYGLLSAEVINIQDKKYNLTTILDITKRKETEDALKHSRNQLKEILNGINANISVVAIDNHEILFMNQHMVDEFSHDFTGQTCWGALRQQKQPCLECKKSHLINQQGEPAATQTWESNFGKKERPYLMNDRAIHWHDGRIVRLQISTDISHIRRMENQLRQKHKMEAIGVMAGGIAHNFNNNLAIILGSLEMAQRKIDDSEKVSRYIENAKSAIFHSRDLVQQIMTYSNTSLHKEKVNVNELNAMVNDGMALIKTTLPSSIRLNRAETAPGNKLNINMNVSQFQEVLINLCNNAVMAMDEMGTLTITTSPATIKQENIPAKFKCGAGRYALLSVQDSGCGIEQEVLERIFDPFFSTKGLTEGTGMGLATVEGIMKQNQGCISVTSQPGQGSTFNLYFPLTNTSHAPRNECRTEQPPRGSERILLVDDDNALAEINSQLLSTLGYKVNKQNSSSAALELFKTDPHGFDLVITDQTMPELTGGQLIAELKKVRPQLQTILCTGYSNAISEESAKELGISAFLMKPLKMDELNSVIRSILDA